VKSARLAPAGQGRGIRVSNTNSHANTEAANNATANANASPW
jgi:hypothetical protein